MLKKCLDYCKTGKSNSNILLVKQKKFRYYMVIHNKPNVQWKTEFSKSYAASPICNLIGILFSQAHNNKIKFSAWEFKHSHASRKKMWIKKTLIKAHFSPLWCTVIAFGSSKIPEISSINLTGSSMRSLLNAHRRGDGGLWFLNDMWIHHWFVLLVEHVLSSSRPTVIDI